MIALSSTIYRHAGIESGVERPDSFNGQYADALTILGHYDTLIRRKFRSLEQPVERDWQITFGDCALHGSHVGLIEGFFTKFERQDYWKDYTE